jgi:tetratricopeptide (TPR) repeat protein
MLTADPQQLTADQRYLLYGRGWLLTHYLFLGGKRDGQLGAYFRALTEGKTPEEAAAAFGDPRKLDSELWSYKRTDFAAQRVPASVLPVGETVLRKLTPGESATMDVRIESQAGVSSDEAPGVYARAKAACAPFPNDSAAQRVLAEAAYDAGDYAGAEAAADRAIAADPNNVDALLYKARARMAVAVKAEDKTPATWRAIRVIIAAANTIDTENPQALVLYFNTFIDSGAAPTKSAKAGLYYAYLLAPQDRGLRFLAAATHLRDGETAPARAQLLTLARDAHSGAMGKLAARMVIEIDAGRPEGALAELEKDGKDRDDAAARGKRK